jgi:hypothetical protein
MHGSIALNLCKRSTASSSSTAGASAPPADRRRDLSLADDSSPGSCTPPHSVTLPSLSKKQLVLLPNRRRPHRPLTRVVINLHTTVPKGNLHRRPLPQRIPNRFPQTALGRRSSRARSFPGARSSLRTTGALSAARRAALSLAPPPFLPQPLLDRVQALDLPRNPTRQLWRLRLHFNKAAPHMRPTPHQLRGLPGRLLKHGYPSYPSHWSFPLNSAGITRLKHSAANRTSPLPTHQVWATKTYRALGA